jgi:cellulose synthase/poly-beta-1,6-N-acetylglucosamine synthase-like glycosyltransferase
MSSTAQPALSASVVIATRSRPELLEACLRGVASQDISPLEVVVVDNSRGEDATRSAALAHGARYVVEPAPGLAIARNRGARESAGEVVAYVDDDAVPERDWLGGLLPEFLDPLVGAVTGRIFAANAEASPAVPRAGGVLFGGSERVVFDRASPDWFERANFGGVGEGCNMAIRRTVLRTWSGFDERLGRGTRFGALGLEEHYAFFGLIDRGYRIVYTPLARVRHRFPQTHSELRELRLNQIAGASFQCALLLAEEPRYRRRAARYALEAIGGTPRPWRDATDVRVPSITGWESALARIRGVAFYLGGRLTARVTTRGPTH